MTPAPAGLAEPRPRGTDPTSTDPRRTDPTSTDPTSTDPTSTDATSTVHDEDVAGTTPVVQASAARSRQEANPVAAWRTGTVDPAGGAGSGGGR